MYKNFEINDEDDNVPQPSPQKSKQIQKHLTTMSNSKMTGTFTQGFFTKNGYQNQEEYVSQSKNFVENNQQNMSHSNVKRRRNRKQLDPIKQKQKVDVFINVHANNDKKYDDNQSQSMANNIASEINGNHEPKRKLSRRQNDKKQENNPADMFQNTKQSNTKPMPHLNISVIKNAQILFADQQEEEVQENTAKNVNPPRGFAEHIFELSEDEQPQSLESNYFNYSNISTLRNQIYHELQNNQMLNMQIIRDKGGFNTFWPEFHLQFKKDAQYIISAKRTSSKPTSTFIISASRTNFQEDSQFYLGKIKSNLLGNVMNIYSTGLSMSDAKSKKQSARQIMATIVYNSSLFEVGRPRQFVVYAKKQEYKYYSSFKQVIIQDEEVPLNKLYQQIQNRSKINVYHNRKPVWQEQLGGYMLNFKGKVDCPSIKNFILEEQINGADLIIFGKSHNQTFNIDVRGPMNLLVAFAVALSTFDSRIMCE